MRPTTKSLAALVLGLVLTSRVVCTASTPPSTPPPAPPPPAVAAVTELHLTVGDYFVFIPAQLRCKAGVPVRLRITHRAPGHGVDIPHTTVLLRRGTNVDEFAQAAVEARVEDDYVPAAFRSKVLAWTPLIHAGGKQEMKFQAPDQRGDYDLVCAFPGHCIIGMKAKLTVE